nr:reverse transcriptase domain-containing protein [Tanacetum cinerariifolium]
MADHLSRLKNPHLEEFRDDDIDDNFPDKTLVNVCSTEEDNIPWFADFANYLVGKILRKGLTYAQHYKFFLELNYYFWDEPYLFKMCPDGMILRCVYAAKTQKILDKCHHGPTGGHYGPSTTTKNVFDAAFKTPISTTPYWLLYEKTCHLPFRIEHRAYWALRSCNPDLKLAEEKQFMQMHELDEVRFQASKWHGPFVVKHGFTSGYVELYDKHGGSFIVNEYRVKLYHEEEQINELKTKEIHLMCKQGKMEAIPFMASFRATYRETMPWVTENPFIYSLVENTCNEAKLYDLDETGEGIVKRNFVYVKRDPSKKSTLGVK